MSSHTNRRKRAKNAKAKARQRNALRDRGDTIRIPTVGKLTVGPDVSTFGKRVNELIARWSYKPTWTIWAERHREMYFFQNIFSGQKQPKETGVPVPKSVEVPKGAEVVNLKVRANVLPCDKDKPPHMVNKDGTFTLTGATVTVHDKMGDEEIIHQMWRIVKDLEDHETDEAFKIDGKRYYNPHEPTFHVLTYWDRDKHAA